MYEINHNEDKFGLLRGRLVLQKTDSKSDSFHRANGDCGAWVFNQTNYTEPSKFSRLQWMYSHVWGEVLTIDAFVKDFNRGEFRVRSITQYGTDKNMFDQHVPGSWEGKHTTSNKCDDIEEALRYFTYGTRIAVESDVRVDKFVKLGSTFYVATYTLEIHSGRSGRPPFRDRQILNLIVKCK